MPARKPSSLQTRHSTKAEKNARATNEGALTPERSLPQDAPSRLEGHSVAEATWRRLMRTYNELEGTLVTRLDMDLLLDYCILIEQVIELDTMRKSAYETWLGLADKHRELAKDKQYDAALEIALKVVGAFDAVIKLDGRVDRKRALLLQMRQSLYLTPRARAGVAPAGKPPEEPEDPLEKLLDDVTTTLNAESA
jgi:phage terminase small subunit